METLMEYPMTLFLACHADQMYVEASNTLIYFFVVVVSTCF